jgi:hypothetical protein
VQNAAWAAADLRGRRGADAAALHACCAAAPVDTLLRVVTHNPSRRVALTALRVIRNAIKYAGWTPPMEACASREALKALLMLSGGVIRSHAVICGDTVWPLHVIQAALSASVARVDVARRLASIRAFWPLVLAGLARGDNSTAMQAWKAEQRMPCEQLPSSVAHVTALLVGYVLAHAPEAAPDAATLGAPLLAALCTSLAAAPEDDATASAIAYLVAAAPGVVSLALKFDLKLDKLRQLCSAAASSGDVARAVRALGTPADVAPIVAALLPPALRAHGVAPEPPAALAALDAARVKRERRAHITADVTTAAQDASAALAAPLPLWRAALAAPTGRARIALARANVIMRTLQLRRSRGEEAMRRAHASVRYGCASISLASQAAVVASASTSDFALTVGLHHIVGAPELVVLADLRGVSPALQTVLACAVLERAGEALVADVCAGERDERVVAAALCRDAAPLELRDARIGVFSATKQHGPPLLLDPGLSVPLSAATCAAAADAVLWRFLPRADALRAYGGATARWCGREGAATGRVRTSYYADNAGIVPPAVFDIPSLVCSLAACIAAAPKSVARAVTAALAGARFAPAAAAPTPAARAAAERAAGASPAAAALAAERAVRDAEAGRAGLGDDLTARYRERMLMCALPGCASRAAAQGAGGLLRKCGACARVAYCSPACQRLDWKRHKPDCTAKAEAAGAGAPAEAAAAAAVVEDEPALAALSVRELRARIAARDLDASGCIEKGDLVRLLLRAAPPRC